MHLYYDKEKTLYNLKIGKKNSKQNHICSTCTILKREVRQLKELQQKIAKEIKIIISYIPR
jgi:thioredoxin-related protein